MTKIKSFNHIFILSIALVILLVYQYSGAQWSNPPAGTPPDNNVAAPINVSSSPQSKLGNLGAIELVASDYVKSGLQVWSPEYCDENGENCSSGNNIGGNTIELGLINVETGGKTMNANQQCKINGYDGLWSFEDTRGNEDVICFKSNFIKGFREPTRFVSAYHALRSDPSFVSFWGNDLPDYSGASRCGVNTLYRCGIGWLQFGDYTQPNNVRGQQRRATYNRICSYMMKNGSWYEAAGVTGFDSGSDNGNTAHYWDGSKTVILRHNNNNVDDTIELSCIGDSVTAQGEWWLKANRPESYGRGGNKYPAPPAR